MRKDEALRFEAGPDDEGQRLDRVARRLVGEVPLSAVFRALRTGRILLNGSKASPERRLAAGDVLLVDPRLAPRPVDPGSPAAVLPPGLEVLWRGADLAFASKPRGMLSHGPGGLDEWAAAIAGTPALPSLAFRPAPLHRLDRNTSGIVAVSASMRGARAFSAALREGRLGKRYVAVLLGELGGPADWEDRLARDEDGSFATRPGGAGDRVARTRAEPLATAPGLTLALVSIATGLTHQIRAQAALAGHPLAGDAKYGGGALEGGYVLHAARLELPADLGCEAPSAVEAPLPPAAALRVAAAFGRGALLLLPGAGRADG